MTTNPFDHSAIDDVIHGRLRLGIMAYLSSVASASFLEVRDVVKATDGNLSAHVTKLSEAGYVVITKSFQGKKPLTTLALSQRGRDGWVAYLERLHELVKASGGP